MPGHFNNTHRPKLGEKVTASATVTKEHVPISDLAGTIYKHRDPHQTIYRRTEQPISGVFIGYRTVAEGQTGWDGDPDIDGGWVFYKSRRFEAWLIVTDPRRNPIYVLPEDVIGVGSHFPDDWRYFKHKSGKGYSSIRVVSRDDELAYSSEVLLYFDDKFWTEITYLEHVTLENAAERGDVR